MKRVFIFSFLVCFCSVEAQKLAEFSCNYSFPTEKEESYFEVSNRTALLKFTPEMEHILAYEEPVWEVFAQWLLDAAQAQRMPVFRENALLFPLDSSAVFQRICRIDTMPNFCSLGDTAAFHLVQHCLLASDIQRFSINAEVVLNDKTNTLDCPIRAFAFLVKLNDQSGKFIADVPLLFYKIESTKIAHSDLIANPDISFVFQTSMLNNFMKFDDSTVRHIQGFDYRSHFEDYNTFQNATFLGVAWDTISPKDLYRTAIEKRDTIYYYQPDTYEEQVSVVEHNQLEELEGIRFVHNWYFDKKNMRLYAKMVAYASIVGVYDDEGNFRFHKPLYYVVPNE